MIILVIFLLLVLILIEIGNYFYNISINRSTDKSYLFKNSIKKDNSKYESWLKTNSKEEYIYSTNNGHLKLHSYIVNNKKNNKWIIIVHGYNSSALGMVKYAKEFNDRDYNILLVDLRGHGLSEGNYIGMGWHERLDIIDWINYLKEKNKNCKIILFGVSMGGATVMMCSGENLPNNVKLIIEDCGYTSVSDIFSDKIKSMYKLPSYPILFLSNIVCIIRAKYSFMKASSVNQIKKSKVPILFIHGDKDTFVGFYMLDILYNAATCKKEKLVVPNATHASSMETNKELYFKTIEKFIEKQGV